MLQIGITGGIGTGKSLVCAMFAELGAPIYDADTAARELMNNDPTIKEGVIKHFGAECYNSDGLNRAYLAKIVFSDSQKVKVLNGIVHPRVGEHYVQWRESQTAPYILKEAALMYESGSWEMLDKVAVVTAPLPVRLERIRRRDPHRTEAEILGIISKQMPEDQKIARADYLINNDGETPLQPQIMALHQRWAQGQF
ncbi:dephospho-CoA kinase [Flexibacter flexilis DSM 6793]|uniref:Dephospho-CoA kinase n=1 Tax=Flexibacter flexilis DSM 6793 TaxID=927664 RepID=A0A1I1G9K4_9BACT|nr:dephospho-CoA kinase [Flexibacter flexilis]SFC07972.1 dephospho-CoA kinase [Flexibacter flexilis DSM 6793]